MCGFKERTAQHYLPHLNTLSCHDCGCGTADRATHSIMLSSVGRQQKKASYAKRSQSRLVTLKDSLCSVAHAVSPPRRDDPLAKARSDPRFRLGQGIKAPCAAARVLSFPVRVAGRCQSLGPLLFQASEPRWPFKGLDLGAFWCPRCLRSPVRPGREGFFLVGCHLGPFVPRTRYKKKVQCAEQA